jgi:DNA-binding Lrp family transcriptional regulator
MQALAERVHFSRAERYARIERLRREGVITGFTAMIDPRRLGPSLSAHIYLRIRQHSWKDVRHGLACIAEIEHSSG